MCRPVTVVSPAKTAEPIEMPFGLRTRMGPRKHVLGGVHTGATGRIPLMRLYAVAMRPIAALRSRCEHYIFALRFLLLLLLSSFFLLA